ncbi:hypothetical protein [Lamprocystis purpurea]|jgi:hypothetical protein|uniref:hypothetical protein n=1 Tax=Lamprocystis purpurea TaxID=61598 RepID=UPI0004781E5A|nr:hypothetical protein [Lamprocystis purpurea]
MSTPIVHAMALAAEVYGAFLTEVVEVGVLRHRTGPVLDQKKQRDLDAGRAIDSRPMHLMTLSGKGGWHPDPVQRARRADSANITLLDHLLSVVRGALTFAAIDVLATNPEANRDLLAADLRVLAAIAFMHDLDKDLELNRDTVLSLESVSERWTAYGLDRFVGERGALAPDQVRSLIEQAEATQSHRSPPAEDPPRRIVNLIGYVALADKLDGLWLKEGIDAVLARLRADRQLRTDLFRDWAVIDLFDPHHPFLVDELQRAISACCRPIPPLLEIHHDGRLISLVPADRAPKILDAAIKRVSGFLSRELFGLRINVSNRGIPELLDAQPDHEELMLFMAHNLPASELANLFRVKKDLADRAITREMDTLLQGIGLAPNWPKSPGQTITPYPSPATLSENAQAHLRHAAHLALLVNHKQVRDLPDYAERERTIMSSIDAARPAWIAAMPDDASRRTITCLWATRLAVDDPDLYERIWGGDGILARWLEGPENGRGLRDTVQGKGGDIMSAVIHHLRERLNAKAMTGNRSTDKHCLFTDSPVPKDATFKESDGLYEIKKSAFSGRDGRLESIESDLGETHISPVSYAEHRLRAQVHQAVGGRTDGIPTLLSSPCATGLFGGLALNNDQDFRTLSVYDLAREQVAKGQVYRGLDVYRHRYRVARFERMPERLEDQAVLLRLLLRASLRIGRPLHLFRGLPVAEKAFFFFDAMPGRLADVIGGNRLRLEQIPSAVDRLDTALLILETNGLGLDVFDRYARPETRLGAVCLTWAHLHDAARDGKPDRSKRFRQEFEQLLTENTMSDTEGPLVALGRAAARIQRRPFHGASANEEMLSFNCGLEAAIQAWRLGQRDRESLAMAIAGELDTNLARKDKGAARTHRDGQSFQDGCLDFARQFVNDVWLGVLNGRPPSQANRRILASIYRMSFLTAPRAKSDDVDQQPND